MIFLSEPVIRKMTPDAYYYITVAYGSIAGLTTVGLVIKKFKKHFKYPGFIEYVLHGLHIPPYIIAAYWYWDAYKYQVEYYYEGGGNVTAVAPRIGNSSNSTYLLY